jgi:RND family efflux transporter MFP subunit
MKKIIEQYRFPIVLAFLLFLTGVLIWNHNTKPQQPLAVTAVPISHVNKPIRLVRAGSIVHASTVPVNTEFSGRLSEIFVTAGQTVKAGQALVKIEALASSANDNELTGAVSRTEEYDRALQEFNRYQKLYDQGAIPRRQLEEAANRLQALQQSSSSVHNAGVSQGTPAGSTVITAPIDGVVTSLAITAGQAVPAGAQLMALGGGPDIELVAQLEQNDLYVVQLGSGAEIEVAGQPIAGQVSSIYPEVQATAVTFSAHIKLSKPPAGLLQPGLTLPVRIDTGDSAVVRAVPITALGQDEQGTWFIVQIADGKAVRLGVNIGERFGELVEIASEVPQDSLVVNGHLNEINDGDPVVVVQ